MVIASTYTNSIAVLIIIALVLAILYVVSKNDWQLTSLRSRTIKVIVSGKDNVVRVISNFDGYFFDDRYNRQSIVDKHGTEHPDYHKHKPGLLERLVHKYLGIWHVSLIFPIQKVYAFNIPKARLIENPTDPKSVYSYVEYDKKPTMVNELFAIIPRPVIIDKAETRDNFDIGLVLVVVVEVVNPITLLFEIGSERFFQIFESAIASEVENYIRSRSHQTLINTDRGPTSPIIGAIKQLNEPNSSPASKKHVSVSRGLQVGLGVKVVDGWIRTLIPDDRATEAVNRIQQAEDGAKEEIKKAEGQRQADILRAEGATAEAERLVKIYGSAEIAIRDITTRNLGQGSNISTLVVGGNGTSILLPPASPRSPTTP